MDNKCSALIAVVPAAGVGKRMQSHCPKQYLMINGQTILDHTVLRLLSHPNIVEVIVAVSANDEYFESCLIANHPNVTKVTGGKERVDSVLSGLQQINQAEHTWVLVHDAARPCVALKDIDALIAQSLKSDEGSILAHPVKDTMKRANSGQKVQETVEREKMWHALTPQMFKVKELIRAIKNGLKQGAIITDESSAMELMEFPTHLVEGSSDNLKITRPDDLALANFLLNKEKEKACV